MNFKEWYSRIDNGLGFQENGDYDEDDLEKAFIAGSKNRELVFCCNCKQIEVELKGTWCDNCKNIRGILK